MRKRVRSPSNVMRISNHRKERKYSISYAFTDIAIPLSWHGVDKLNH
jgi:hypothetical protein